jgi:hypothetical protein
MLARGLIPREFVSDSINHRQIMAADCGRFARFLGESLSRGAERSTMLAYLSLCHESPQECFAAAARSLFRPGARRRDVVRLGVVHFVILAVQAVQKPFHGDVEFVGGFVSALGDLAAQLGDARCGSLFIRHVDAPDKKS